MALAMAPRKKNVHDPGFAKKRDEAQVVEERSHRVGAASSGLHGLIQMRHFRDLLFLFDER